MLLDSTRQEVWNEIRNVERNCRYYEIMHSRFTQRFFAIRLITLILIASGLSAMLDILPWANDIVKAIVIFGATGLTIWDAVSNYSKRASIAHVIHLHFARLRTEWRELWLSVDDESTDETAARHQIRDLFQRAVEVESWAGFSEMTVDKKLNIKTGLEADAIVKSRYYVIEPQP